MSQDAVDDRANGLVERALRDLAGLRRRHLLAVVHAAQPRVGVEGRPRLAAHGARNGVAVRVALWCAPLMADDAVAQQEVTQPAGQLPGLARARFPGPGGFCLWSLRGDQAADFERRQAAAVHVDRNRRAVALQQIDFLTVPYLEPLEHERGLEPRAIELRYVHADRRVARFDRQPLDAHCLLRFSHPRDFCTEIRRMGSGHAARALAIRVMLLRGTNPVS